MPTQIPALQQQQKQLEEELAAIRTEENPHIIRLDPAILKELE